MRWLPWQSLQLGASTFRGTLSTFRSLIFDLSADIGENLLGPLTAGLRGINDRLIENRDRVVAAFVQLPQFFSRLAANVRASLSSLLDPVVEGAQTLGDRVFAALAGFGAQFGSVLRAGAATGFQALLQVAQVSLRLLAATIERAVSQDSGAAIVRGVARLGQLAAIALGETFKASSSILPGLLQTAAQLGAIVKRPKVKILVLECPPKTFNENIVLDTASAVHADTHIVRLE